MKRKCKIVIKANEANIEGKSRGDAGIVINALLQVFAGACVDMGLSKKAALDALKKAYEYSMERNG